MTWHGDGRTRIALETMLLGESSLPFFTVDMHLPQGKEGDCTVALIQSIWDAIDKTLEPVE